ncbi:hypothetical protein [Absidia glauca]|uniref:Uncharacterized protein n=1 Tax=Absidia glauca TaxID=4829 RepID=A0A163IRS0_ABSGL|nr:hypothetical protein [Absidia glauca]
MHDSSSNFRPPRQAQEWSYFSQRESIGKALSSPGIRSNKNTHINCGSSARTAGNVCANVDHLRRQGRWNNTTINGAYPNDLPRELVQSMAGFPTLVDFFILHVPPFTHLPVSARGCSWRSANDMTDCRRDHDVQEDFYTRLGAHDGFPPPAIPFGNILSSLTWSICHSKVRDMLQVEAQEHDPAHTLLQQCVPMHSRFSTPIGYKIIFLARPIILLTNTFLSHPTLYIPSPNY